MIVIGNNYRNATHHRRKRIPGPYQLEGAGNNLRINYQLEVVPEWWEDKFDVPQRKRKLVQLSITRSQKCWGIQIERSAFATSFIPTHDAPATRDADNIQLETNSADFTKGGYNGQIVNSRTSPAYAVIDGKLVEYGPGESRIIKNQGMLVEQASTNYVLNSKFDPAEYEWSTQQLQLSPGTYTLSWYGAGKISIYAPCIWVVD